MANFLQAREIERYHRHLLRCGRAESLDQAARIWIRRYARLWRSRFEGSGTHG
jgi:hypothetical protein